MIDAIVVPQGAEYKAVYRAINQDKNSSLPIISIPIGFNQAKAQTQIDYIKSLKIKKLLIVGLCGSLSEEHSVGDVVLYQSCFDPHHQITLETDPKLTKAIHDQLSSASLVTSYTSDRAIDLASEKQKIYDTYQTDVVDMEGFSYLQLLQNHNIGVAILRVVSDHSKQDLPDLTKAISDRGPIKIFPLIIAMIQRPLAATELIKSSLKGLKQLEKTTYKLNI